MEAEVSAEPLNSEGSLNFSENSVSSSEKEWGGKCLWMNSNYIFHEYVLTYANIVPYRCDSWTIKKAECRGSNVFELWC